jgi:CRP/FNR family transcriptional regulator, cyclic AMP receptor protein
MIDQQLAEVEQIQRWPAGKMLFGEGDQPCGVYVVHSGEVELAFFGPNGVRRTFRLARKGEVVGLSDAVSQRPHDCTATTRSPARIGFIPIEELLDQLDRRPELWLSVARVLSADVTACWDSMRRMNTTRVSAVPA